MYLEQSAVSVGGALGGIVATWKSLTCVRYRTVCTTVHYSVYSVHTWYYAIGRRKVLESNVLEYRTYILALQQRSSKLLDGY